MREKIIYDEQGLKPGTRYEKGQWKEITTHNDKEIKGFFGEYRFLSNFWKKGEKRCQKKVSGTF